MIDRIDHVVLNCVDVEATAAWYERVMGFEREEFFGPIHRIALKFGRTKINLRPISVSAEEWFTGVVELPGALDLCFITEGGIGPVIAKLETEGVEIIRGPGPQQGALGPMTSVYFRDPSGNLLEIASYDPKDAVG
jgi:catechol 2,3-dioxygenase-like lactoylglutathione lyase family enzyme